MGENFRGFHTLEIAHENIFYEILLIIIIIILPATLRKINQIPSTATSSITSV